MSLALARYPCAWAFGLGLLGGKSSSLALPSTGTLGKQGIKTIYGLSSYNPIAKRAMIEWDILLISRGYTAVNASPTTSNQVMLPVLVRSLPFKFLGFGMGGYVSSTYSASEWPVATPWFDFGITTSLVMFIPIFFKTRMVFDARVNYSLLALGVQKIHFVDAIGLAGVEFGL